MKRCTICHKSVNHCDQSIDHRVGEAPVNVVAIWLALIGTPERAKKLRPRLPYLVPPGGNPDLDFGPEPRQCPTTVLFGYTRSRTLYYSRSVQPALDAWDNQTVTAGDLHRWCTWIEEGNYSGPVWWRSIYSSGP